MIQPNQICLIVKLYNNRPELLPDSNDLGYVNYDLDYPAAIKFVPEGETLDVYRRDYNDNMVNGYIYGEAMAFDALMERIKLLQQRFRDI